MLTFAQYIQQLTDVEVQTLMIDVAKASPILAHAPLIPANGGEFHKYKHYTALPSAGIRERGDGFVVGTPSRKNLQIDLLQLGTICVEDVRDVDTLYPGNPAGYFDAEAPIWFESMGQKIATALFYGTGSTTGTFHNLKNYASENSAEVDAGGGTGTGTTDIFCVKWDGIATGVVVNPAVLLEGAPLIRVTAYNNLQPIAEKTAASTQQPVYKVGYDTIFNLLNNTKYHISVMKGVKNATNNKPTAARLLELIDKAKATPGDSFIYMNRDARRLVAEIKDGKINTETTTENYVTTFGQFEGIPLVMDENIVTVPA